MKQFTGCLTTLAWVFDLSADKPLWLLVDTPLRSTSASAPNSSSYIDVYNKPNTEPALSELSVSFKFDRWASSEAAAWLSWPYLCRRSLSLWCLSVNWLAFSGSDPDVWCKTQTPHIKGNWGVGEWISILEEILTLGIEVMRHPAFRILCDITESKNLVFSPL